MINSCTYWYGSSINEITNSIRDLKVYPVPADNELNLSFVVNESDQYKIRVFDILGNAVYSEQALFKRGEVSKVLNISGLSSGLYFISVSGTKGLSVTKRISVN